MNKLSAIVFTVADLDRTQTFYESVVGLDLQKIEGHDGAFLVGEVSGLSIVFLPGEARVGNSPVVVFGVENEIERVVEELAKAGAEIVTPVSVAPDGGLTADFTDPDGHLLSVHQPSDEDAG